MAGLCDDLVRGLLMVLGVPAFTASLTVNLRAATPLGAPVADGEALLIAFRVPA